MMSSDVSHAGSGGTRRLSATNHRGHGPRDYQKSDERLREEVCEALAADDWLDARDMNVGVDGGEVVLSGVCASYEARLLAESIALSVLGVRAVHNFIGLKNCDDDRRAES